MEDFQEQITAMYLKKKNNKRRFFQQKKQTLQDLTQSLNLEAIRCLCKIWEWDKTGELVETGKYELIHALFQGLTEGFHAERAYRAFWVDFYFLQDWANFSQTDLFDMKSIVA